jgi:hypothetical protein
MELRDFLKLVTADGLRCVMVKYEVGVSNMPAKTIDHAVQLIETADSRGKDVYFALASFKDTKQNNYGKVRVPRKRRNIDKLKALWLDIDLKDLPDGKSLQQVLKEFLDATSFPKPTAMVHSGNGVHLYWPLDRAVDFREWLPLAQAFKLMCQRACLPADHACTADGARVLRPVQTHNYKSPNDPKPVRWVGGSGACFSVGQLGKLLLVGRGDGLVGQLDEQADGSIPAHLKEHLEHAADGKIQNEYTAGSGKPQSAKTLFQKCTVMRQALKSGGADQSEPEWNATLMLLAHLDEGAKFVHPMSKGHIDYDPDTTAEKWQQKLEAVEDGTGPTTCATFESFHPDTCQACPFYKSKKVKTPKSLAYFDDDQPAKKEKSKAPRLVPVGNKVNYPKGWRENGFGFGMEHKVWDAKAKEEVWEQALSHIWRLKKAARSIQEKSYNLTLVNICRGHRQEFPFPSNLLGTTRLNEELAQYGAPLPNATEVQNFRTLMATWLSDLRAAQEVQETTDQLGWIEQESDDGTQLETTGFTTGTEAYMLDGEVRENIVTAGRKQRAYQGMFEPKGSIDAWKRVTQILADQKCRHLQVMVAAAFAGPLVRFVDDNAAVLSVMSEDSGAGKSSGMAVAQAVWGSPKNAPATIQDTRTSIMNKLAYINNLTMFWDEVRGTPEQMDMATDLAFQVTQGKDKERANQRAETIQAQTWELMLVTASNESLFDIAARKHGLSDANALRFFEIEVSKSEFPEKDHRIGSLVHQLSTNYGQAGKVYGKWLVDNYSELRGWMDEIKDLVQRKTKAKIEERLWVNTVATIVAGAKFANEAGLMNFDVKDLMSYMLLHMDKLRARKGTTGEDITPVELVNSYMMQHSDGKVTVDWMPHGRGGDVKRKSALVGSHSHVRKMMFVWSEEQKICRVSATDFKKWLEQSRGLRWTLKLQERFMADVGLTPQRAPLAIHTKYQTPRMNVFTFDMNKLEEDDAI